MATSNEQRSAVERVEDEERLATYQRKRDFSVTSEPSGAEVATEPAAENRFVVQRHRASRLHYDLRLEGGGVLLSWAVPKGPTLDPDVRRMAVHVEDHPLDYFDFEGVIPAGEYGGGDVIVWDWGTWQLSNGDDPIAAVEAGNLRFDLFGEKLVGHFALVRRGDAGRPGAVAADPQARRPRRTRVGRGGSSAIGEVRSNQRRGQRVTGGDLVEQRLLERPYRRRVRRARRNCRRVARGGSASTWSS